MKAGTRQHVSLEIWDGNPQDGLDWVDGNKLKSWGSGWLDILIGI